MKAYLDINDIRQRYNCGTSKAQSIIRAIKAVSPHGTTGALGKGKVLPREVENWEAFCYDH